MVDSFQSAKVTKRAEEPSKYRWGLVIGLGTMRESRHPVKLPTCRVKTTLAVVVAPLMVPQIVTL